MLLPGGGKGPGSPLCLSWHLWRGLIPVDRGEISGSLLGLNRHLPGQEREGHLVMLSNLTAGWGGLDTAGWWWTPGSSRDFHWQPEGGENGSCYLQVGRKVLPLLRYHPGSSRMGCLVTARPLLSGWGWGHEFFHGIWMEQGNQYLKVSVSLGCPLSWCLGYREQKFFGTFV